MRISKELNLVIPMDGMIVHSMPISRDVFEQFYKVIAKTYATLASEGLMLMGPRVAYLTLKEVSGESWCDVENGLINEIVRLSNIGIVGENGWKTIPLATAIGSKKIDKDSTADIKGQLVFFTCVSSLVKKEDLKATLAITNGLWGSQSTLLNSTEYVSSLSTSTEPESSGEMANTSSVPR